MIMMRRMIMTITMKAETENIRMTKTKMMTRIMPTRRMRQRTYG